ncbi:hypothetical protein ACVWBI_03205, partial [Escherichia coli]
PMVKKSLRQFTLMATATVTLLLGSVPLYAQTADVQQKLAELECISHLHLHTKIIRTLNITAHHPASA